MVASPTTAAKRENFSSERKTQHGGRNCPTCRHDYAIPSPHRSRTPTTLGRPPKMPPIRPKCNILAAAPSTNTAAAHRQHRGAPQCPQHDQSATPPAAAPPTPPEHPAVPTPTPLKRDTPKHRPLVSRHLAGNTKNKGRRWLPSPLCSVTEPVGTMPRCPAPRGSRPTQGYVRSTRKR